MTAYRLGLLGLASLSVLVSVALLELGLQAAVAVGMARNAAAGDPLDRHRPMLAEPHEDRVFELRVNARQLVQSDEFSVEMVVNSRRLRDREHVVARPQGVYRVLALGDSFTFGWGVGTSDTWWARLAALLERDLAPMPVEVINLGVYMYTFDQQVDRLEDLGLAYEPDLIVAGFYYPHVITISNHVYQARPGTGRPRIHDPTLYVDADGILRYGRPLPFERLRRSSLLADFTYRRLKEAHYRSSRAGRLNEYELLQGARQEEFAEVWGRVRAAYDRLAAIARGRGTELAIFMIPRDRQVSPAWKRPDASVVDPGRFRSTLPQQQFRGICDGLRLHCLDLLPTFQRAAARRPELPLYFPVDVHWTPAGHALAARAVRDYIAALGLARRTAGFRGPAAGRRRNEP